jgi:flagellar biogenesis protein FliO
MERTLGTVLGGLGIVLGVLCVIVWCSRRLAPAGNAPLPKEAVESLGRAPLAGKQQVQLLRVGSKLLLIAVSPTDSQPLMEITDAVEVEHLLGLVRREKPGSSSAAFREMLSQLANEPAAGGFAGAVRTPARGGR